MSEIILVVDDEQDMLENCSRILNNLGYTCITASNGDEAMGIIKEKLPDLIITDLKMPGKNGLELLKEIKKEDSDGLVIIFTAFATIESAVDAVKSGAFDYLPKPFTADQLKITVERALNQKRLAEENRNLKEQLHEHFKYDNIIGQSQKIKDVLNMVSRVARTDSNILLLGESGTGKELIARCIHANSNRAEKPFITVDCASLPENLLESELFGHEKGSFTGAHISRQGMFETANGGTLFLDEIGELTPNLQAKLLRILQERQLRRVGGRSFIDIDIRVISATNKDLGHAIQDKEFREDLFFRLNVISISLPPLRERLDDIPLLCNSFLKKFSDVNKGISDEAVDMLKNYNWPGNVRELQNVIERAVSLSDGGIISVKDLPDNIKGQGQPPQSPFVKGELKGVVNFKDAKKEWLSSFEKDYLIELLKRNNNNITKAAEEAGIPRMTIYRMMKKYNLKGEQ
ncbi:MAG: sigma-54-dependent Fis family transcriptional regulator [Nitrospinae bacterium]|nr:sigma-54-dependent Fis family transcriptional regulator [Nitrospinota bacterium]